MRRGPYAAIAPWVPPLECSLLPPSVTIAVDLVAALEMRGAIRMICTAYARSVWEELVGSGAPRPCRLEHERAAEPSAALPLACSQHASESGVRPPPIPPAPRSCMCQ